MTKLLAVNLKYEGKSCHTLVLPTTVTSEARGSHPRLRIAITLQTMHFQATKPGYLGQISEHKHNVDPQETVTSEFGGRGGGVLSVL